MNDINFDKLYYIFRFHDTLKTSVENLVLYFLHDLLWPLVTSVNLEEDHRVYSTLYNLYRRGAGGDSVGVRSGLQVPLPAALVELAALDQGTTPLDRLTMLHDAIALIHAHIRESLDELEPECPVQYPSQAEEVLLLATLLIKARLRHVGSTILYIETFTFSSQPALMESLRCFTEAVNVLRTINLRSIIKHTSNLNLEDLVRIADKLERRNSDEVELLANPVMRWHYRQVILKHTQS